MLSVAGDLEVVGEVSHKAGYGFGEVFLRAILGGWLVALIAWLVAASRDTISRIFFVIALAALIPAAGASRTASRAPRSS